MCGEMSKPTSRTPPKRGAIRSVNIKQAGNGLISRTEYDYQDSDGSKTYGPDEENVHAGATLDDVHNALNKKLGSIDKDDSLDPKEKRRAKAKAYLTK